MLQNKFLVIIIPTVLSQLAFAKSECDKKTITTQGTTYSSTEYKKSSTDNNLQTVISGIFKFTWNGKALNVYRCTKNEFPPYVYLESACKPRNDIDFTTKKAVLKNIQHDPILMITAKTDKDLLILTINSKISEETKTTVVKLDGKTAKINGLVCSDDPQNTQTSSKPRESATGR